jgi:hypothetical protein
MRVGNGLTTWNMCIGRIALMWRWNMPVREALHTFALRRLNGGRGYATAGPFILEWCPSSGSASHPRNPENGIRGLPEVHQLSERLKHRASAIDGIHPTGAIAGGGQ